MKLTDFKALIKQRCGLTFEGVGEASLVSGLQKRIAETGAKNASAYYASLMADEHEFHELIALLTINETYFYREPEQLQLLVNSLIPRILTRKQDASPVRILCAGCSSGEEPYSIAIALREKYGESAASLFMLAGGDIDKGALEKARIGCYTEFSFRSLAPELRERYFNRQDKRIWGVKDDLRQQVHFYHVNLLVARHPDDAQNFDIIFFRNVSIYFDMPTRRVIQQHLATLLNDDGYLITGIAETLANNLGVFNLVEEGGLFYFAKQHPGSAKPLLLKPKPPAHQTEATSRTAFSPHRATQASTPPVREAPPQVVPLPLLTPVTASAEEALRLIQEKRYDEAMTALALLLEQYPGSSAALLLKAHILLHRKDYAAAEESAQQALGIEPWSTDAFVLLGLVAKWRNQADTAVKWFKQAVYARNECWPAHYYLGELYRADSKVDNARRAYRVVLQLLAAQQAPNDGLSIIPLGLPVSEVRFLCEHQLAKLDDGHKAISG
ncbi:MAG: CheR family methyltransferase [Methylovulum sp.]|nr:CheR family methyltransferase [Methylovulum sp.]